MTNKYKRRHDSRKSVLLDKHELENDKRLKEVLNKSPKTDKLKVFKINNTIFFLKKDETKEHGIKRITKLFKNSIL
jgi:hypothetical protein